jgi:hypothetical protein
MSIEIDRNNADLFNELTKRQPCVSKFYMDGCIYCEKMEAAWNIAVSNLKKNNNLEGAILNVNRTALEKIGGVLQQKVTSFPTILATSPKGGVIEQFNAPRDVHNIEKFCKKHLKKTSKKQKGLRSTRRKRSSHSRKKNPRYKRHSRARRGGTTTMGFGLPGLHISKKKVGRGPFGKAVGAKEEDVIGVNRIKVRVRKDKHQDASSSSFCNIL